MKKPEQFTVGVETGPDGYSAAWCFDLPGCYTVVAPGEGLDRRMRIAILEFMAWSHNRAADRLELDDEAIEVVQTVSTGADVRGGHGSALFLHDMEPPTGKEFPQWANAHDLAMDELRALALTLPPGLLDARLEDDGRTLLELVLHTATSELWLASRFGTVNAGEPKAGLAGAIRLLGDTHALLQQVVCDVPGATRVRKDSASGPEDWTVRKVMRSSIQHLRYHTWELRRELSAIWLSQGRPAR